MDIIQPPAPQPHHQKYTPNPDSDLDPDPTRTQTFKPSRSPQTHLQGGEDQKESPHFVS